MYRLRVEDEFSAAHFLASYPGKCEKLHGHNYRVRLFVSGSELDNCGMLLDFSLLKKTLKEVLEPLDHSLLNDIEIFGNNPSAERIAEFVFKNAAEKLAGIHGVVINAVDVFENDRSMARYEKGNS